MPIKTRTVRRRLSGPELALAVVAAIAVLYAAKPIAVPLALALLLTFILAPVVAAFERLGSPRVYAVGVTTMLALAVVAGVGWLVGHETRLLVTELPEHKEQIRAKLDLLRNSSEGAFGEFFHMIRDLTEGPLPRGQAADAAGPAGRPAQPVVLAEPRDSGLARLVDIATPVFEPLASAALVVFLVAFMLANREDLRDRLLRLFGRGRLSGTTRAMEDAAERVSRYLLSQLAVNVGFGIVLTAGLWLIDVPFAPLWGFMAAVLRFIPYLGTWAAAAFPLLLTAALAPGWVQPLEVFALFAALDVIVGQIVEPLVFGHGTGVSPFALLVAAAFWTWLWGPIGLLLSTPLTVCLVVLGQHAPRLRFLALLLGHAPALSPPARLYQRLLAKDEREATSRVKEFAAEHGVGAAFDEMITPALAMARYDRRREGITAEEEEFVVTAVRQLVAALGDSVVASEAAKANGPVVACPAHQPAEEPALDMLALLLRPDGVRVEAVSANLLPAEIVRRVEETRASAVFIATLPPGGVPQAAYLCRLLRQRFAALKIVVGWWGNPRRFDELVVRLRRAGADYVTTSLAESRRQLLFAAALPPAPDGSPRRSGPRRRSVR